MADNLTLNSGSGGVTLAADDIGGVHHQRVKVEFGADNSATEVAATTPLPVEISDGTDTALVSAAGAVMVDGSGVTQPVSGTVTETNSGAILADTASIDTNAATIAGAVAAGQMQVDIVADGAGLATAANQLAADHAVDLTSEHTRNAAFAESIAIGGEFDDTTPVVATEGNVSPARITAQRALHANLRNVAGTEIGTVSAPVVVTDDGNAILVDGSASTQPVSGTVTVTHPALGGGTEAGAQRVTIANDSTGVMTVDGTVAVTGVATAANQLPDGHNVTVDNATGAPVNVQIGDGTSQATVRNLAANDSLNVAIVDGAGDQITSFGGGTQYTEDDAAPANPVGNVQQLVRLDTPTTLTSLDGDVVSRRGTNYGAAYTQILDSSGNFIDSFGGSGGTSAADDADFVAGTTAGTPAMGVYESSPTSVTDGDLGTAGITATRQLRTSAAQEGTWTEANSAAILADTAAMDTNLGTVAGAVAAGQMQVDIVADGAGLATAANQLANGHDVTIDNAAGASAVNIQDGGNSITIDGTVTANAGTGTMTVDLAGNNDVTIDGSSIVLAEDAVHGSGNAGVMSLAVRNDDLANLVSGDGDYAPLQVDEAGALYVNPAGSGDIGRGVINVASSGDNTLQAAAGAGVRIRVTSYVLISAGTVNVRFESGAAGTALTGIMPLIANTGISSGFNPHGHFETAANTLLNLELSAAISVDGHFTYVLVP